mmetsp:Transcript_23350/g.39775  ORF Transcript_23350/g.39775 Transcript_23350/m.39775 type:complete len:450 (+) Transcript_23350:203-1552(+)
MTLFPPSNERRRVGSNNNRSKSCHVSTLTALPLFLLALAIISGASIYISLSLLNKNASVLQHAEHSMLRPPHHNHHPTNKRRDPIIRTAPYPRAITIHGAKLQHHHQSSSDKKLKSIQPKTPKTRSSYDYRDPLYEDDCIPMQSWQETSFPTCSTIHELDFYSKSRSREFAYLTSGGYNDIFTLEDIHEVDPKLAIKILAEGTTYTDRNYDRVRRDGLILERSTKSRYVMDIYGFCGFLVLVPHAGEGNLPKAIRRQTDMTSLQKLQYAYEVSAGLAAVHDIDGEKMSAVTQGDLKADQYLFMDGVLKIGDFNRGRFLRRNSTAPDTACTYTIGVNDAAYRSPEEYKYLPETSAIDVWAVGSLIYHILHRYEVWDDIKTNEEAQQKVMDGKLPKIADEYVESDDPAIKAMLDAIDMCYVYDPEKRAKAWDVSSFLEKKLDEIKQAKGVE